MKNRSTLALLLTATSMTSIFAAENPLIEHVPPTNAYFGDLHVHTSFSTDARIFGTVARPGDAYRFAKGEAIEFQDFGKIRLKHGALDFMAVTDHAEDLGILANVEDPAELGIDLDDVLDAFAKQGESKRKREPLFDRPDLLRNAWLETIEAAESHYQPGKFTTFVGFEWTSRTGAGGSLHRNVIFRGREVADKPFSLYDSARAEDLWTWLDKLRSQGKEALAIPHNANLSEGHMWSQTTSDGDPVTAAWAEQRLRNEVLVEITQVKGTSEAHPLLSPEDQWANFEIYEHKPPLGKRITSWFASEESLQEESKIRYKGSYIREAYKQGLIYGDSVGFNPYKFGLIGSTDTHNAASAFEEDNYISKGGKMTARPQDRLFGESASFLQKIVERRDPSLWGAAGLAAIWAESNTREAIYDAFRRKETFATTGTRIKVRFFAGFDFEDDLNEQTDAVERAYELGIPMGGDLVASGDYKEPQFFVWAIRDANSAPLQRIQIIKGWVEAGTSKEKVFDVVASDGLLVDPATNRIADNGAAVDVETGRWDENKGANELSAVWRDPEFNPDQRAFYYVRVLENPTLRWSTHDANTLNIEPLERLPITIQERAYTSPIWYSP